MSWTVTKDGVSVTADTQAELAIALAALNTDTTVVENRNGSMYMPVEVNAPIGVGYLGDYDERVSTMPDGLYGTTRGVAADELEKLEAQKPKLTVVPETPTVQHITVTAKLLEVLEAVMLFAEGVGSSGVATLLGKPMKTVTGRMQMLQKQGLVERVPHSTRWRATQLARRAKLVKC